MAAPGARGPRGASSSPPESGSSGLERPPPGPGRCSAPRTVSPAARAIPLLGLRGGKTHVWSFDGEQEEAGGNRPNGKRLEATEGGSGRAGRPAVSRRGCEEGPRHRGFAGTRSLAGTAARKQQAERLCSSAVSDRPPRASRRHCRRRRPARAAPPRTSPRAPPQSPPPPMSPGSFRPEAVSESQASTRKLPLAAPPTARPTSPSPAWVPSCSAQLGQGKVSLKCWKNECQNHILSWLFLSNGCFQIMKKIKRSL
ncbi:collagen alpha-1(II) chain-like [Neovison vison]|uniref:collagen alpha-1(II) chain-like n=1 Tax=Neovison vison TaxID=452646 RepID=UPI001CF07890|nr:collagen alpha-1(II) chain-like [Neogale vison]